MDLLLCIQVCREKDDLLLLVMTTGVMAARVFGLGTQSKVIFNV